MVLKVNKTFKEEESDCEADCVKMIISNMADVLRQ